LLFKQFEPVLDDFLCHVPVRDKEMHFWRQSTLFATILPTCSCVCVYVCKCTIGFV